MEIIDRIRNISLFKDVKDNDEALRKIINIISVKNFSKGSIIIEEGKQGEEMFILNKGKVIIEKKTLEDESYTVVELSDEMNIFFGELALMDNDLRSATVQTLTNCECYVIKKSDFEKLGNEEPKIGLLITREIAKILSGRLRKSNKDIITLFEALVSEIAEE